MSATSRDETWNPGLAHRVEPVSYLNAFNLVVNRKARNRKVKGWKTEILRINRLAANPALSAIFRLRGEGA